MPDWSYRTVFRPLLFRLPFPLARDLCLGFMGGLARLPLGSAVIDFLGHMRPDARLKTNVAGLCLPGPVVLGPFLDPRLLATTALSRFGIGMIEVGPVGAKAERNHCAVQRRDDIRSLVIADPLASLSIDDVAHRLPADIIVPVLLRLGGDCRGWSNQATVNCEQLIISLRERVAAFGLVLDERVLGSSSMHDWGDHVRRLVRTTGEAGSAKNAAPRPLLICLAADIDLDVVGAHVAAAMENGAAGIVLDGRLRDADGKSLIGRAAHNAAVKAVRQLRHRFGPESSIIAGGADDPESALDLLAAGATAVQIDAGLAYVGPGLPKRINEAVLFARAGGKAEPSATPLPRDEHAAAMSWFWALLLGVAMVIGGLMALWFASTRVLLPYDEAYLGMSPDELTARIPRLLHFMAHDRVTLAGTMLAVGIQYVFLAWCGIRRGEHWAKIAVVASGFAGFLSFFLFLGFGYFDPLHAFVTAILFQFLLLAFQGRSPEAQPPPFPNLVNDWRWQLANWGQLLLIAQGTAVFVAGATIASVGITSVFVPEDLEFMQTTVETLRSANPRLVPVIAHDRASFGGMLISVGLATLLPALWGIRQGASWIWWMLALAGTIGYGATLIVHLHVGYIDPMHLAPAFGGFAMLWLALGLLFPCLAAKNPKHTAAWGRYLSSAASKRSINSA